MGGWISLLMHRYYSSQIKGFLGIGSAPEFLTRIMWKKFPKKTKSEILKKGISKIRNGDYEYLITKQLILDGKKTSNKVLNRKLYNKNPVTMVHGQKDEVVPVIYSKKVLKIFPKALLVLSWSLEYSADILSIPISFAVIVDFPCMPLLIAFNNIINLVNFITLYEKI